jgi:hypothetical protein
MYAQVAQRMRFAELKLEKPTRNQDRLPRFSKKRGQTRVVCLCFLEIGLNQDLFGVDF